MRVLVPFLLLLAGCGNACQQMCVDLAVYAENDCGLTIPDGEVDACKEANAEADDARLDQCAETRDPEAMREWWDCEDLAENWTNVAN